MYEVDGNNVSVFEAEKGKGSVSKIKLVLRIKRTNGKVLSASDCLLVLKETRWKESELSLQFLSSV